MAGQQLHSQLGHLQSEKKRQTLGSVAELGSQAKIKRGSELGWSTDRHRVPWISQAWQSLARTEREVDEQKDRPHKGPGALHLFWARIARRGTSNRQNGEPGAQWLCGWSGVAHPYGAPLCSCSLSKSICCWWKGAPLPPPLKSIKTHPTLPPYPQGRCWVVKP